MASVSFTPRLVVEPKDKAKILAKLAVNLEQIPKHVLFAHTCLLRICGQPLLAELLW